MCVEHKFYVLGEYFAESFCELCRINTRHRQACAACSEPTSTRIECYDLEKNQWDTKTEVPTGTILSVGQACSLRVFKGSKFLEKVSSLLKYPSPSRSESLEQETSFSSPETPGPLSQQDLVMRNDNEGRSLTTLTNANASSCDHNTHKKWPFVDDISWHKIETKSLWKISTHRGVVRIFSEGRTIFQIQ